MHRCWMLLIAVEIALSEVPPGPYLAERPTDRRFLLLEVVMELQNLQRTREKSKRPRQASTGEVPGLDGSLIIFDP